MPERTLTIAAYAAGASLAAATLVYVFGPTFFLDDSLRSSGRKGVVGLQNAANDCFINSVLQALAGLGDLRVYLAKEIYRRDAEDPDIYKAPDDELGRPSWKLTRLQQGIATAALKDILDKLNERPLSSKSITPSPFIRHLEYAFGSRISRQQQDAQEFLQLLTERLSDEHIAGSKARAAAKTAKLVAELGPGAGTSPAALIQENLFPFEGKLDSLVECQTCGFSPKPSSSNFVTLTLNVPQRSNTTTLDDCFDGLLKQEFVDDYSCDRCRLTHATAMKKNSLAASDTADKRLSLQWEIEKLEKALEEDPEQFPRDVKMPSSWNPPKRRIGKYLKISSFPKILAIHLSRSIFDRGASSTKNTSKVLFPENLMLGGLERKSYKLLALITHQGGHSSGHYETFRRQLLNPPFSPPNAFHHDRSRPSVSSTNSPVTDTSSKDSPSPTMPADRTKSMESTETSSTVQRSHSTKPSDATSVTSVSQVTPSATSASASKQKPATRLRRRKAKEQDRWWRISDDKIKDCSTNDLLGMQREAYLLFYELEIPT